MQIKKALITAAGTDQSKLAMQSLVDRVGEHRRIMVNGEINQWISV